MLKKKDNLTDFVEKLPEVEANQTPEPQEEQQVVDSEGELITLANKNRQNRNLRIHTKSFELKRVIIETTEKELKKMGDKIIEGVKNELKNKNLF